MTKKVIYEMFDNPPPPILLDEYKRRASEELENLLATSPNIEKSFSRVFRRESCLCSRCFPDYKSFGFYSLLGMFILSAKT